MGTKKGRHRVFFGGSCPKLPSPWIPHCQTLLRV